MFTVEGFYGDGYELVYASMDREDIDKLIPFQFEDAMFLVIKEWDRGNIVSSWEVK